MCASEMGSSIAALSCGHGFTAAVLSDGRVYAWGRTDKGQVGVTKGVKFIASTQVTQPRKHKWKLVVNRAQVEPLKMELPSTHKHALFVACGESVTAVIAK
jgi:alpha-tubulin suppressor-like RCC1 family protein